MNIIYSIESMSYPAEIFLKNSPHITLQMIVTITNSIKGNGFAYIPTLPKRHDDALTRRPMPTTEDENLAASWNYNALSEVLGGEFTLEDVIRTLGVSKNYTSTFVASIIGYSVMASEQEGITLTHGKRAEMNVADNKPVEGELDIFLLGIMTCYPHLICTPGFTMQDKARMQAIVKSVSGGK